MLRATSLTTAAITGGNVPFVIGKSGVPFIGLSSGSVAAGGAITAITALPIAYPSAYCFFPANILAGAIAAGWYYCTFSSTTAGTAFLNTYTSGQPVIPASPTAVTAGQGAFTGDIGEEFGPTFTIPAGAIGKDGQIRIAQRFTQTSNADVKTARVRLSGNAGTIFFSYALASTAAAGYEGRIVNCGATGVQLSVCDGFNGGGTVTSDVTGTVDMTAATTIVLSTQRATATDNTVIEPFCIEALQ